MGNVLFSKKIITLPTFSDFFGGGGCGSWKILPDKQRNFCNMVFGVDDFWFKKNVQNRGIAEKCVDYN